MTPILRDLWILQASNGRNHNNLLPHQSKISRERSRDTLRIIENDVEQIHTRDARHSMVIAIPALSWGRGSHECTPPVIDFDFCPGPGTAPGRQPKVVDAIVVWGEDQWGKEFIVLSDGDFECFGNLTAIVVDEGEGINLVGGCGNAEPTLIQSDSFTGPEQDVLNGALAESVLHQDGRPCIEGNGVCHVDFKEWRRQDEDCVRAGTTQRI